MIVWGREPSKTLASLTINCKLGKGRPAKTVPVMLGEMVATSEAEPVESNVGVRLMFVSETLLCESMKGGTRVKFTCAETLTDATALTPPN